MSEPRPREAAAERVTARMYVSEFSKMGHADGVKLNVAYQGGHNAEWASSTPTGSAALTIKKGIAASRFFEEAQEEGDDIEITFRRIPREE